MDDHQSRRPRLDLTHGAWRPWRRRAAPASTSRIPALSRAVGALHLLDDRADEVTRAGDR